MSLANATPAGAPQMTAELQQSAGCTCNWPVFIPSPWGHKSACPFYPTYPVHSAQQLEERLEALEERVRLLEERLEGVEEAVGG